MPHVRIGFSERIEDTNLLDRLRSRPLAESQILTGRLSVDFQPIDGRETMRTTLTH
jgi:hypothetical protein